MTSTRAADEQHHLLEFYIFDVRHKRNLNLTTDSDDKRLIIFYNISNGLYALGIRNGELFLRFVVLIDTKINIRNIV